MENKEFSTEGLRKFYDTNSEDVYFIVSPTTEDIRGADWEYSKTYTKSLVEGITTSAEMTDILMRRGIIGPEYEKRANELSEELGTKIEALKNSNSQEEKAQLAVEVAIAREEVYRWNQRLNTPLANTCEQIADDARVEYLTHRLIVDEKGERVWKDYNEYLNAKNQALAQKARLEVMLYLQGLDSDFLDHTPEAMAMKEIEDNMADEALKEIQEATEQNKDVSENIEKLDNTEEDKSEPKKKATGRKKTTKKPVKEE